MFYPLNLNNLSLFPLFGDQLQGEPHVFDFSSQNSQTFEMDTQNFEAFQEIVFSELEKSGVQWGIGQYLEERSGLLQHYPQMISENRVFHAGLDIIVPEGFRLFAPLDAKVFRIGKEEELGSYGGFIALEHNVRNTKFYSFYGHLHSNFDVSEGEFLKKGQAFARIGARSDSGGWFTHTHLQILTERAVSEGFVEQKGYVSPKDLQEIERYFPSPYYLFRW